MALAVHQRHQAGAGLQRLGRGAARQRQVALAQLGAQGLQAFVRAAQATVDLVGERQRQQAQLVGNEGRWFSAGAS